MTDPYVELNRALLLARSEAGKAKYGTDLSREDLTPEQWCQHGIEEALDLANYLQRVKGIIATLTADRDAWAARAAELLTEVERLRAAEARLRELASAEPVACVCTYEGPDGIPFNVFLDPDTARRTPPDIGEPVPLIRRPEMPR